jgi:hypothetical protein
MSEATEVKNIGFTLEDIDIIAVMLNGLNSSYHAIKHNILSA